MIKCYKSQFMIDQRQKQLFLKRDSQVVLIEPKADLSEAEALELFRFIKDNHKVFNLEPKSSSLEGFPFEFEAKGKVVLFPGSFSPWHEGHEACVRNLPDDSLVVVMPDHNPWKEVREGSLWQETKEIWQALGKIQDDCPQLHISLYLGFLGLKQKNPTITWLRNVTPKEKWLLMGEDTFLNLHRWTHGDEVLMELDGLYVCPRAKPQEKVLEQKEFLIKEFNSALKIEFLAPHKYEHYSSTWLREKAKKS